jgi:hypothetical protein
MVKPVFRRKSIGTKVSEEEYARLEALAGGRATSEWVREVLLRELEGRQAWRGATSPPARPNTTSPITSARRMWWPVPPGKFWMNRTFTPTAADSGEVDQGSGVKAISIPAIPIR